MTKAVFKVFFSAVDCLSTLTDVLDSIWIYSRGCELCNWMVLLDCVPLWPSVQVSARARPLWSSVSSWPSGPGCCSTGPPVDTSSSTRSPWWRPSSLTSSSPSPGEMRFKAGRWYYIRLQCKWTHFNVNILYVCINFNKIKLLLVCLSFSSVFFLYCGYRGGCNCLIRLWYLHKMRTNGLKS